MVGTRYNRAEIHKFLENALTEIGSESFANLKLLALEKRLRALDKNRELPGKTVLREAINTFRAARWPSTAPKRASDRFRY